MLNVVQMNISLSATAHVLLRRPAAHRPPSFQMELVQQGRAAVVVDSELLRRSCSARTGDKWSLDNPGE